MKRNYFGIWLLLAVAFIAIAVLSAFSPVSIGRYELRDSGLMAALTQPRETEELPLTMQALDEYDSIFEAETAPVIPVPVDTLPKTLLFIGDSMLEGLSPRLAAYAKHNGHTLYSVIWYSSTSEVWGRSGKLKSYIDRINPDFVFISLGANELFVKDIMTKREGYVKTILSEIGDIPYLWIGPPNWKPDTGINALIAKHAAGGSFFLSDGMTFERAKDGAHPTRSSAVVWMDSVVRWMNHNSSHPFRLEAPPMTTASAAKVFIHQPNEQ
ncbi:MAG: SGNH/GDSL hydrolase family protein [Odoribacter sp.]|nr:SGNH/GDSL hydrolase family protein [Odoribacter sp.]